MKKISHLLLTLSIALFAISCEQGDPTGKEEYSPTTYDIKGKVEKGPFVSGSNVSIQPMDANMQVVGEMYNVPITDNVGNFMLGSKVFPTPYAELMATGYFFNEVKGELSSGMLTLRAVVDFTDKTTVNVNVLTHLTYARIKALVASGKSFRQANSTAQRELFEAFGLGGFANKDASMFSMIAGTEESAVLIAISSLLLADRSEAALTEYLSMLSEDFGADGEFSEQTKEQIATDKKFIAQHIAEIEQNIIDRYSELGIEVQVKELTGFIDWDDDGKVGNEMLGDEQSVTLSHTTIEVPNEGGEFSVEIDSPITIYLEPQISTSPTITTPTEQYTSTGLYEGYDDYTLFGQSIRYEKSLDGSTLTIVVEELESISDKSATINLYDFVGNIVASVELTQSGRDFEISPENPPLLGEEAQKIVGVIAEQLASGIGLYNIIEQYYAYNKTTNRVEEVVNKGNRHISNSWGSLYTANRYLLIIANADEERLGLYADYCNILSAICYSTLVYGWGGVPYISHHEILDEIMQQGGIKATAPNDIFYSLKKRLGEAIKNLPEKRNEPTKDINSLFFASKDVARALLANIHLYEGNYDEAEMLYEQVINSGFYELDSTTDYHSYGSVELASDNHSGEIIYALVGSSGTRASIVIQQPNIIPYITLGEVYLSLSECCYMMGDIAKADRYVNMVAQVKGITLSESDTLANIKALRERLFMHTGTYFAFLKRTGLAQEVCDIQEYRLLLPIPESELYNNRLLEQNPGY